MKPIEPFGFSRAEPFGWTNCAETDDGAAPLYDQAAIDGLVKQRDELLKYLKWALPKIMRKPCEWCSEEDLDAHDAAIKLIDSVKGGA